MAVAVMVVGWLADVGVGINDGGDDIAVALLLQPLKNGVKLATPLTLSCPPRLRVPLALCGIF